MNQLSDRSLRLFIFLFTAAGFFALVGSIHAQTTYTWDVGTGDTDITDGSGTWTNGAGNWFDGTTHDQNWVDGNNDAFIGDGTLGAAGTVTLGGDITARDLKLAAANGGGDYIIDLDGNTLTLRSVDTSGSLGTANYVIQNGVIDFSTNDQWSITTSGGGSLTVSAQLTGIGTFRKFGGGNLNLTNDLNDFTGNLDTNNGQTVTVSSIKDDGVASAAGAGGTILVQNNSALTYTGAGDSTNRVFQFVNGQTTLNSSGSGALIWTGTINNNSTLATKILNLGGTNTDANEIQGVLADNTGLLRVDKEGSGNWILSGANTYTGATNVNNGTLQIGNGGTTGSLATTSTITNNGALVFNRSDTVTQGTEFSVSPITGSGSVTQGGSGTLILGADNTYNGVTRVNDGVLKILHDGPSITWGAGSFEINNNSRLEVEAVTGFINFQNRTFTFDSNGGGFIDFDGNILWRENTIVTTGGAKNTISGDRFNMQNTRTAFYDVADGTDAIDLEVSLNHERGSIVKSGTGTLALTNTTNNLLDTNTITINAGTLEIATGGRISNGNWGGAITNNGTIEFSTTANQILSGVIDGTGALVQSGSGTLTLSGANIYTGTTTVSAGTLLVDGSTAAGSALSATGGTLGGIGTIGGASIVGSGASLTGATDGTIGTLSFGQDLNAAGSTWLVDLAQDVNGSADLIAVAGNLDITNAILTDQFTGSFMLGNTYTLATYTGSLTGTFSNWGAGVERTLGGGNYIIDYGSGPGSEITLTAVPEPAAFAPLLFLLFGGIFLYRRRRKIGDSARA